jgi:hypothetical protein
MDHREIVMQRSRRGQKTNARVIITPHSKIAALEIRLHACASFQEKLHQLLGKCITRRAQDAPFSKFHKRRIRGKF